MRGQARSRNRPRVSGCCELKTINHVGIPITDRKDSLPFYRDLAGLEVIPAMEDGKALIWTETLDHTMIHTIEGAPIPHLAFEVEDFDAALAAVRAAGIEIIKGRRSITSASLSPTEKTHCRSTAISPAWR